jgi:hypothetical protein
MKTKLLLSLCSLVLLTGCIAHSVPRTKITGSIAGQPFTLEAPKDADLRGLAIIAENDGAVSIEIESLVTRMNPEVITTTAEGQVKMISAVGAEIRATSALAKPTP